MVDLPTTTHGNGIRSVYIVVPELAGALSLPEAARRVHAGLVDNGLSRGRSPWGILWARHPYKVVTGLAALVGVVTAVVLDLWALPVLIQYPVSTSILTTVIGVSIPLFLGALLFDRFQAAESARQLARERDKQLINVLARQLAPMVRRATSRLRAIRVPSPNQLDQAREHLGALKARLDHGESVSISLPDLRAAVAGIDDLCLLMARLEHAWEPVEEVDDLLTTVEGLGDKDIRAAATAVAEQTERLRAALQPRLLRYARLVERMAEEHAGTWDGQWVQTSSGGFAAPIDVVLALPAMAEDVSLLVTTLEDAMLHLDSEALRTLDASGSSTPAGR